MGLKLLIIIFLTFSSSLYSKDKKSIVNLEANEAPPFWSKSMSQDGMAGEIVHTISKAVGIEVQIVFKPLSRMIDDDTNNDLGNPAFFILKQDFAEIIPIALYHTSLYYYGPNQKEKFEFNSIDDLKGKNIGVLKGTLIDSSYFKKAGIKFQESYTQESLFKKLKLGRLDFVIEIELVAQRIIYELFPKETASFVRIPISKSVQPIAIMLSSDYPNAKFIAQKYRQSLKEILTNGIYKNILDKYYKEEMVLDNWIKDLERFEKLYEIDDD